MKVVRTSGLTRHEKSIQFPDFFLVLFKHTSVLFSIIIINIVIYIYIYIYVCVCVCVCTHTHTHTQTYALIYTGNFRVT